MALSKLDRCLANWERIQNEARLWFPVWQDQADYIQPRRANISIRRTPGARLTEKLFDSTAVHSAELLAASMQGALTPSSIPWLSLRIRGTDLNEEQEIATWLDTAAHVVLDNLRQSNFNSESHEIYADLGVHGTGAIFEDELPPTYGGAFPGLRFQALPVSYYGLDENAEGRADVLYYTTRMSARAAVEKWGEANLSDVVTLAARSASGGGMERFEFLHAIFPREGVGQVNPLSRKVLPAKRMPYASLWVDLDGKKLIREGGFHEQPFMIPRWTKASGETYGRGPGFTALPDVKTLNKQVELKLSALSLMVKPPVMTRNEGVLSQVRLIPGGRTSVRDMEAIKFLVPEARFDVNNVEEEKLRQSIRRLFFSDQLQLQEGPAMTAYEVQVRYELMQRILGPTLGRLETEFLDPVVTRTFWILYRAGLIPEMPVALQDWLGQGNTLDIEYEGPLVRAARLSETVATQRFLQIALPLAEADEGVMDLVDVDEIIRSTGANIGINPKILRPESAVTARRAAKHELNKQAAATEQAAQQAEIAGKAAPMLKALIESQKSGILAPTGIS